MDTVIRIRPEVSKLRYAAGAVSIAEIDLGGTPRGAALVLCDTGQLEAVAADVLNGLAEHGYSAIAAEADPAGTAGPGPRAAALIDHLRARGRPDQQIGVLGYGSGAATALAIAAEVEVGAVVSLAAAALPPPPGAPILRAPWLGLFSRPGEHAPALRTWLAGQAVYSRVVTYPGTSGSPSRSTGRHGGHAAAFDSWQRSIEWLNLRVEPCPTPLARSWAVRHADRSPARRKGN